MKKLIILLFSIMLITLPAKAQNLQTPYDLLNPPKTMEFNSDQSLFYLSVANGCSYLYALQNKHAAMAILIDGGQSAKDWYKNTSTSLDTWMKFSIIYQRIMERDHKYDITLLNQYKVKQFGDLNQLFSITFFTMLPEEYFNRLLNSTTYCVQYEDSVIKYLDLVEPFTKPEETPDKPKRRM